MQVRQSNVRVIGMTKQRPVFSSRGYIEDTQFEFESIYIHCTSSEIVCLSLSSFPLTRTTRSLANSHLATDRSHRTSQRQRIFLTTTSCEREPMPIDPHRCSSDISNFYQISLAKCRKITLSGFRTTKKIT